MKRHRWVVDEPHIPFEMDVLYEDERIIVVDKPHFLATTPRGMWYRETALIRLRERYGEPDITPAHRLDRQTAGIVVFVRDPAVRGAYQMLFQERRVAKVYECLAPCAPIRRCRPYSGTVRRLDPPAPFPLLRRSHIVKDRGVLQAYETPGVVNAETVIALGSATMDSAGVGGSACRPHSGLNGRADSGRNAAMGHGGGCRRYTLHPRTGKTHQLRVHMNSLGLPILGDDLYPNIVEKPYDDFTQPLELVARSLEFIDPVSEEPRRFVSRIALGGEPA